jgi:glutamate/tyrosine decarboxylase-like PLP-dependent enzyme
VIRQLRPLVQTIGLIVYVVYRCLSFYRSAAATDNSSFLSLIIQAGEKIRLLLDVSLEIRAENSFWIIFARGIEIVIQDGIAIMGIMGWMRILYKLRHYRKSEWIDPIVQTGFEISKAYIKLLQKELDDQADKAVAEADKLLHKDPHRTVRRMLPDTIVSRSEVLKLLQSCATKEQPNWKNGKLSGTVYFCDQNSQSVDDRQHTDLMAEVYRLYAWANPLHPGVWPRVNQCEAEVIAMTSHLLHGKSSIGMITSGGTESIFTAVRAHLEYFGKRRGIAYPEIIAGTSAHAALDKACEIFGIRLVSIDCNHHPSYHLDPQQVQKHITSNTILIYASAPSFPQGVLDPIDELSRLAVQYDIGLHVDACLGAFVLPFCDDVPPFDFRNPGVTSISADTHKYGCAPKGTSVVLFKTMELRHAAYYCYPHWTGGLYITPTLAGSRPGALIACTWAAMVTIGKQGYQARAVKIVQATRTIAQGVQSNPLLKLMTFQPTTVIVCFGSDQINIYQVQDALSQRGWTLNSLQRPSSIHLCVTPGVAERASEFLQDLQAAVEQVKNEKNPSLRGTAEIYGATGKLPAGPLDYTLCRFIDATLSP